MKTKSNCSFSPLCKSRIRAGQKVEDEKNNERKQISSKLKTFRQIFCSLLHQQFWSIADRLLFILSKIPFKHKKTLLKSISFLLGTVIFLKIGQFLAICRDFRTHNLHKKATFVLRNTLYNCQKSSIFKNSKVPSRQEFAIFKQRLIRQKVFSLLDYL